MDRVNTFQNIGNTGFSIYILYISFNTFPALLFTHFFGRYPSVELHNRYIRRYIPKGADIRDYDKEYINKIEETMNNLPRKIHGYRTPKEIYTSVEK